LFEVFSQRYERGSIIVTSNLPFDEWTGVFVAKQPKNRLVRRGRRFESLPPAGVGANLQIMREVLRR
jgi:DNA replication protein DnaC